MVGTAPGSQLVITTARFGTTEHVAVDPSHLYIFPEALPGLPDSRRFVLIEDPAYQPMCWLQSLDEAPVCLPVLRLGGTALGGYAAQAAAGAGLPAAAADAQVLLVTRYDAKAARFVANLLAPIVLDPGTGSARQIVLEGQSYPLRQPLQWDPEQRTFSLPC